MIGSIRYVLKQDRPRIVRHTVAADLPIAVIELNGFQMELSPRQQPIGLGIPFVDPDIAVLRISEFKIDLCLTGNERLRDTVGIRVFYLAVSVIGLRRSKLRNSNLIILEPISQISPILCIRNADLTEVIGGSRHIKTRADNNAHLATAQPCLCLPIHFRDNDFRIGHISEYERRKLLALLHLDGLHILVIEEISVWCLHLFHRNGPAVSALTEMPAIVAAFDDDRAVSAGRPISTEQGTVNQHFKASTCSAFARQHIHFFEHDFRLFEVSCRQGMRIDPVIVVGRFRIVDIDKNLVPTLI